MVCLHFHDSDKIKTHFLVFICILFGFVLMFVVAALVDVVFVAVNEVRQ